MSKEKSHQTPKDRHSRIGIGRRDLLLSGTAIVAAAALGGTAAAEPASTQEPGPATTPNIDRIAKDGMMFTDYYAEQSCTAGRSTFITGQCTLRTGLSKVGIPGATVGLQARDATLAELLKPLGYATGQFGKNHLGDRNEYLPTVHGFDDFFGNLYHLNAEEDPENWFYPRDPQFRQRFGPRGVLRCKASDRDDPTEQPRWGRVGRQTIEDTGPLTKKRMETID